MEPLLLGPDAARGPSLWLKRDDRGARPYGGNKPRKLEWLLADARRQGARCVLTAGGIGSNHALATTLYGSELGLAVHLLLFPQPVTEHVKMSLRLYGHFGARLHLGEGSRQVERQVAELGQALPSCYAIPMGGSTPLGALGFVDAAFELAEQVRQGLLPCPSRIFVAAGTCGTLAGLVLGTKLAGLPSRVIGVRVVDRSVGNPAVALQLAAGALRLLRQRAPTAVPELSLSEADFDFLDGYFGDGYGCPTAAGQRALRLAREHAGLELEPTYTGKTLAAVLDACGARASAGTVLYWNTFAGPVLADLAAGVGDAAVPSEFRGFLANPAAASDAL